MNKVQRRLAMRGSRRDFWKGAGLVLAGSALGRSWAVGAQPDDADLDAQVKFAIEGTPVRLTNAQLTDLKKDIQEDRKGLAKIRDFKVRADVEPGFVFRAK